jgi:hypothetical protein
MEGIDFDNCIQQSMQALLFGALVGYKQALYTCQRKAAPA